jgi:hypothetical protein
MKRGAIILTIVVQLGTAMIRGDPSSASGFTSGTTSGTSGSIRNADDLSMHTVPAAATSRTNPRATDAPAAERERSTSRSTSTVSSCTVTSRPPNEIVRPADRADANGNSSSTGNARASMIRSISVPTAPVAPTTATFRAMESPYPADHIGGRQD